MLNYLLEALYQYTKCCDIILEEIVEKYNGIILKTIEIID